MIRDSKSNYIGILPSIFYRYTGSIIGDSVRNRSLLELLKPSLLLGTQELWIESSCMVILEALCCEISPVNSGKGRAPFRTRIKRTTNTKILVH